ncbi:hypothetical protein Tco_0907871 [Tanacetum coccineum]|uniref:Uncharacterized protein n=1 Tax=Tanacetum coccineum TaxID=301880 RepID=A0ABQ5CKI0_9ASTR
MLLYIKGKEHGKLLVDSFLNGPFQYGTITEPETATTPAIVRQRRYDELIRKEKIRESVDIKANNIVLQGNLATIQDKRVTVQTVQGRQTQAQGYAGSGVRSNAIEEDHMARQCSKPKRPRNSTWFKEKAMLVEALESGVALDEEHMALLADNGDIVTTDTEETLKLAEESRLKMFAKQNDQIAKEKKVNIAPIDYVDLNKLFEHLVSHFVPQKQLSAEQAFWLPISKPVSEIPPPPEPVLKGIPHELPPINLVKDSFNKMRSHVNEFENVVTVRTMVTGQNEGA